MRYHQIMIGSSLRSAAGRLICNKGYYDVKFELDDEPLEFRTFPCREDETYLHYTNEFASVVPLESGEITEIFAERIDVNPVMIDIGDEEVPIDGLLRPPRRCADRNPRPVDSVILFKDQAT